MDEHDQRFKELLREFFAEFLRLFFPAWADRFDFAHLDWLTQEVFTDPPHGRTRQVDLVARLRVRRPVATPGRPRQWIVLVRRRQPTPESGLGPDHMGRLATRAAPSLD